MRSEEVVRTGEPEAGVLGSAHVGTCGGPTPRTQATQTDEFKEEIVMTVVVKAGQVQIEEAKVKKESSDSGKETDSEGSEEKVTDEEFFQDCLDVEEDEFEGRTEFNWSCLDTIQEEEEVEEEDSGNDSDLEKSELEQFEQLEQMCLEEEEESFDFDKDSDEKFEQSETEEEIERNSHSEPDSSPNYSLDSSRNEELQEDSRGPRIKSYHDYKRLVGETRRLTEYQNQVVVERGERGAKIRPAAAEGGAAELDSNSGSGKADSDDSVRSISAAELRDGPTSEINRRPVGGLMKHEPDVKPKSALKRASSKKRKKYKVQFDESLNKFFEADYVILIREECGGSECDCGGGGGPADYCYAAEEEDEDEEEEELSRLELSHFEPPDPFVDQLTLSPPDGYKDYSASLDEKSRCESVEWPPTSGRVGGELQPCLEDGTTQTTPTNEEEDHSSDQLSSPHDSGEKKERYIVETITMTTVTERRIIRETGDEGTEEAGGGGGSCGGGGARSSGGTGGTGGKEMTLTFKLGSNSLKPNSALRQLFPRIASPPPDRSPDSDDDSLQSSLIKRTIERNTLRRSLVRYPDLKKRNQVKNKNENSLVERIKKLTCDIDEEERSSPPGEESSNKDEKVSAYRKITDIFIRSKEQPVAVEEQYPYYRGYAAPPDLGNGLHKPPRIDARRQFLSSLAPLTACVGGGGPPTGGAGCRDSTSTEYSLDDIEEALKTEPAPQPDVVAGTPRAKTSDELALFVEQDAGRLERLRKRYSGAGSDEDDADDYGFNRRPSVRGIKPRFGSTTEILQQMQSQITPPLSAAAGHISWPYYPENGYRYEEARYPPGVLLGGGGGPVGAAGGGGPAGAAAGGGTAPTLRLPYQPTAVQVQLVPQRQVVVRGTQTISTSYYQIPRYPPVTGRPGGGGPLLYYPPRSSPVACNSPTKMKLERGTPEGASAPPHHTEVLLPPPGGVPPTAVAPAPPGAPASLDTMMYAMNV